MTLSRSRLGPPLRKGRAGLEEALARWTLGTLEGIPNASFVRGAYLFLLQRHPDAEGFQNYMRHLQAGTRTRQTMLAELRGLDEFWFGFALKFSDSLMSLHRSRCLFVQSLPRGRHILDLGGTHQQSLAGAFPALGYPYEFERLVIVDLPVEERHRLYQEMGEVERVQTPLGPVEYVYRSMTDLSVFEECSFDLVYSGQSIEHVTETEADEVLHQVWRVLRPGGFFCLDTPNGRACRLQLKDRPETVTNPDHKIEYTHEELADKLARAGYAIEEAKGLNYLPRSFASGEFSHEELATSTGVYHEIEDSYVLAYVCRKPATAAEPSS